MLKRKTRRLFGEGVDFLEFILMTAQEAREQRVRNCRHQELEKQNKFKWWGLSQNLNFYWCLGLLPLIIMDPPRMIANDLVLKQIKKVSYVFIYWNSFSQCYLDCSGNRIIPLQASESKGCRHMLPSLTENPYYEKNVECVYHHGTGYVL